MVTARKCRNCEKGYRCVFHEIDPKPHARDVKKYYKFRNGTKYARKKEMQ